MDPADGLLERCRFRSMGTDVELLVVEPADGLLAEAEARIRRLEARWSRFVATSDVATVNRAAGAPTVLPRDTVELIAAAVAWSHRTGGWFDPTVLPALEHAGYDRSFEDLGDEPAPPGAPPVVPGVGGISIDHRTGCVLLPAGVRLDLGGIGKGRAADLVAEGWAAHGVAGCANLGGDLRAVGRGPGGAWSVGVIDPAEPDRLAATIGIVDGAVATSSTVARRWTAGGRAQHHLIDPRTGRPAAGGPRSATVVAPTAEEAEVWAKVAIVAGPVEGAELLAATGLPALVVDDTGTRRFGTVEDYLW